MLPPDTQGRLQQWDSEPAAAPAVVTSQPHRRLGIYVEQLYACLLKDILGWQVLAQNLPVRNSERTLGEIDFLVRNPGTGEVEHHEIAVKFYLAYPEPAHQAVLWYGPNAQDRLDIKTRRLLEHQIQLTRYAEAEAALEHLAIQTPPKPRIFMPGYLFYPFDRNVSPPAQAAREHARGRWLYLDDAQQMHRDNWAQLRKPNWLGPWIQTEAVDEREVVAAFESVRRSGRPRLFANLDWDSRTQVWKEQERVFVVPACWPGV